MEFSRLGGLIAPPEDARGARTERECPGSEKSSILAATSSKPSMLPLPGNGPNGGSCLALPLLELPPNLLDPIHDHADLCAVVHRHDDGEMLAVRHRVVVDRVLEHEVIVHERAS